MAGDRVEGAELVDELLSGIAGEHDVQAGEPVAGVGRAGQLPDLTVEGVQPGLGVGRGLVGARDGGLLLLELDLGLVDLLGDDLQLVAGVGDELGGLGGVGGVTRGPPRRSSGAS